MAAIDDLNTAITALTETVAAEIAGRDGQIKEADVIAATAKINALNDQLKTPAAPAA